jgi:hypothetical protein
MSINASSFSAGYTGSVVVANTSAKVGQFRGFVVNSDCVVSACLDQASAIARNSCVVVHEETKYIKQTAQTFCCLD